MSVTFARTVDILKAMAEPTRLRLLLLLAQQDLTVTDLTAILGQSQPRVSRHLKLMAEAGLVQRQQEGAFAFFRLGEEGGIRALLDTLRFGMADPDGLLRGDTERLGEVRRRRAEQAARYFAANAAQWDRLRTLYVPDAVVEGEITRLLADRRYEALLDVGTGTGRLLELLAPSAERAVGIDSSREMLQIARAKLDAAALTQASVRHGDVYRLPVPRESFDLVTIHQVLHFLDAPDAAIEEAARMLSPGGRIAIVDLAPHALEHLRQEHAHLRLGFSHETMAEWLNAAGLAVERVIDLTPKAAQSTPLTVTIWIAAKPHEPVEQTRHLASGGR